MTHRPNQGANTSKTNNKSKAHLRIAAATTDFPSQPAAHPSVNWDWDLLSDTQQQHLRLKYEDAVFVMVAHELSKLSGESAQALINRWLKFDSNCQQ